MEKQKGNRTVRYIRQRKDGVSILDHMLAMHSAPTLMGHKTANLFNYKIALDAEMRILIAGFLQKSRLKGIYIRTMCRCENCVGVLVYNRSMLAEYLSRRSHAALLDWFGYGRDLEVEGKLDILRERFESGSGFPHEIGLFLGYPPADVMGFVRHGAKKAKFCGYWQVYGDEKASRKQFGHYNSCRQYLCSQVQKGFTIAQALNI